MPTAELTVMPPPATLPGAPPATGAPAHTSVPRDDSLTGLAAARRVVLVRCGDAPVPGALPAVPTTELRVALAPTGEAEPAGLRALEEHLAHARVGTRIVIAGPEAAAYQARAIARAAGAIDEEMHLVTSSDTQRRVWCAHCHRAACYPARVADLVTCEGCGRSLVVYHHYSRHHAAYLGYQVDAEEPR